MLTYSYFKFLPYSTYIGPSPAILSYVGATSALAVTGIPIFFTMMWLTRWFSEYRIPKHISRPLKAIWFAALLLCGYIGIDIATDHSEHAHFSDSNTFMMDQDVVHIGSHNAEDLEDFSISSLFLNRYNKKGLVNENIMVDIGVAAGNEIEIKKTITASGNNKESAEKRARGITTDYKVQDGNIMLPAYFYVDKQQKLRDQSVDYTISIPVGKTVTFDRNVRVNNRSAGFAEHCHCNEASYTWTMGDNGLYSNEWLAKYRAEKEIQLPKVDRINIDGKYHITITKGNERKAVLKGHKSDIEKSEYVHTQGTVSFMERDYFHKYPTLEITVPSLESIHVVDAKNMDVKGFDQDKMAITYHTNSKLKLYGDIKELTCDLADYAKAELIGSGDLLDISLNGANIDASKYLTQSTVIKGQTTGRSKVHAEQEVSYDHYLQHRLDITGSAKKVMLETDQM